MGNSSITEINSNESFIFSTNETYSKFLANEVPTTLKKARRVYIQMRSYQHCFNHCAKRAESQCLLSNGCKTRYPTEVKLRENLEQCDGLFPKVLHSSFNSCECLKEKMKMVKLTNICPMIGNRFLMTVL